MGTNIALIALAFLLRNLGTTILIGLLMTIFFSLIGIIYYRRNLIRFPRKAPLPMEENIIKSHKILTLAPETVDVD